MSIYPNYCFYSSFIFIINIIIAYYFEYYIYSFLFFLLLTTSLIVHSNSNIYTYMLDQISIFLIVFYASYLYFTKLYIIKPKNTMDYILYFLIPFTFLLTIFLYYYGYMTDQYCYYKEDKNIADKYHSLLHFIASFGHSLVIIM